jgi:hypothetical protein
MRKKRCKCCHELYEPLRHTYREQKTCNKPACRAWRKKQAYKNWAARNPLCKKLNLIKQRKWRARNVMYWKEWRRHHPGYVRRNRRAQRVRNAKNRGLIAKTNALNLVCIEKLRQIRFLHVIAKENAWEEVVQHQIDGICQYLQGQLLIAKENAIDTPPGTMRE